MSKRFVVPPPENWVKLSGNELLEYLKKHKLASPKATEPKTLYHESCITHEICVCSVVGYVDQWTTVIDIDGQLSCIMPDYLAEMQAGKSNLAKDENKPDAQLATDNSEYDLKDYVVFDIETTGFSPVCCEIIEIGAIRVKNGQIVDTFETLIKPSQAVSTQITELTGITNDMLKDAPCVTQALPQFLNFAGDSAVVGHNVGFDIKFIREHARRHCARTFFNDSLDTLQLARRTIPGLSSYKLSDLVETLNIPCSGHHRALADAESTRWLFQYIQNHSSEPLQLEHYDPSSFTEHSLYNSRTLALQELKVLIESAAADNQLTLLEIADISAWLDKHLDLTGEYPFDRISIALRSAMDDGVLDPKELQELITVFQEAFDPVSQVAKPSHQINVASKQICLTGNFDTGSKQEIIQRLQSYGAIIKNVVNSKLDYLIVGGKGSTRWCAGNYGTKVKKALELQEQGVKIEIIRENDFFSSLCIDNPVSESHQETECSEDVISTSSLQDNELEQNCINVIHQTLKNAGYDPHTVLLQWRTPPKAEPYFAIEILGRTCFSFDGKRQRTLKVAPAIRDLFQPFGFKPTTSKDPNIWRKICVSKETDFTLMSDAFLETYEYCLRNSADGFDCCSRYQQCSNAKKCVHPDKQFAGGCSYRQKIRRGIIFY